jgi:hypothetical protein
VGVDADETGYARLELWVEEAGNGMSSLLVLDNCEDPAATEKSLKVFAQVLRRLVLAKGIRILLTSREKIRLINVWKKSAEYHAEAGPVAMGTSEVLFGLDSSDLIVGPLETKMAEAMVAKIVGGIVSQQVATATAIATAAPIAVAAPAAAPAGLGFMGAIAENAGGGAVPVASADSCYSNTFAKELVVRCNCHALSLRLLSAAAVYVSGGGIVSKSVAVLRATDDGMKTVLHALQIYCPAEGDEEGGDKEAMGGLMGGAAGAAAAAAGGSAGVLAGVVGTGSNVPSAENAFVPPALAQSEALQAALEIEGVSDDTAEVVAAALAISLNGLSIEARKAALAFSVFPGSFKAEAAVAVLSSEEGAAENTASRPDADDSKVVAELLRSLHRRKILSLARARNLPEARYEMHPLVRAFCRSVLDHYSSNNHGSLEAFTSGASGTFLTR